jgi:hypothetical protein
MVLPCAAPKKCAFLQNATRRSGVDQQRAQVMPLLDLVRLQHPKAPDCDLAIDQSKLTRKWVLGAGAFGEVWFGTWEAHDGTIHKVAIKVLMSTAYGGIAGRDRVGPLPSLSLYDKYEQI